MNDLLLEPTKIDFPNLANKIITDYFSKSRSLQEGVIDTAKAKKLNPEEIKRLVEKTNTLAVVKMLQVSEDKKGTIPVVNYDAVLEITHPEKVEEDVVKIASEFSIPNTREKNRLFTKVAFPTLEKTASHKKKVLPEIFKLETEVQKVTQEKVACEGAAQDGIDYIVSEFYKWKAPSFSKFASEAHSIVGEKCKFLLDKMAEYLSTKVEYDDPSYVDDRDPLLQKFAGVINNLEKIATLEAKKKDLKEQLNTLWAEAKHDYQTR